jgi:hypothetical protein
VCDRKTCAVPIGFFTICAVLIQPEWLMLGTFIQRCGSYSSDMDPDPDLFYDSGSGSRSVVTKKFKKFTVELKKFEIKLQYICYQTSVKDFESTGEFSSHGLTNN